MARFFGLVLMVFTAAVVAELIVHACTGSPAIAATLALTLLPLGVLFGLVATERHYFWSLVAAAVIAVWLLRPPSGTADSPVPAKPSEPLEAYVLFVPVLAILAGSFVGARLITRRLRAATRPQDQEE